jgi:hypothetical protein
VNASHHDDIDDRSGEKANHLNQETRPSHSLDCAAATPAEPTTARTSRPNPHQPTDT